MYILVLELNPNHGHNFKRLCKSITCIRVKHVQ